jgi:hypothetical protein
LGFAEFQKITTKTALGFVVSSTPLTACHEYRSVQNWKKLFAASCVSNDGVCGVCSGDGIHRLLCQVDFHRKLPFPRVVRSAENIFHVQQLFWV